MDRRAIVSRRQYGWSDRFTRRLQSDLHYLSPSHPLLMQGDSLFLLHFLPDNSVDCIVCDPPYMLGFMGKAFDVAKGNIAANVDFWRECLRVLKPGGYVLAFGGTRTSHRMICAIEDAGFYIADSLRTPVWCFGSGFPKSLSISKEIDRIAGAEREIIGKSNRHGGGKGVLHGGGIGAEIGNLTAPATDAAKQYAGFGTSLKPAHETICMARKPNEKGLNIAQNVQKWGTGGLNIDACRIAGMAQSFGRATKRSGGIMGASEPGEPWEPKDNGRWPANVILSPPDAERIDAQTEGRKVGGGHWANKASGFGENREYQGKGKQEAAGGASRFFHVVDFEPDELDYLDEFAPLFYCAKASQAERHAGISDGKNIHPTVKPLSLLQMLSRLVCPPGGIILDPFMGSGSGGVAALREGFQYIGIEREQPYYDIAQARINHAIEQAQARKAAHVPTIFDEE